MKYTSGNPFFFNKDISYVLREYKKILKGKGTLRMGKYVKEFEKKFSNYIGVNYSISTTSATSALETIFNSIELKKDDEVIIPCQSYIASLSTILRFNANPIVAEIDNEFNLDFLDMKKKITKKTKAVVIVHFGGKISKNLLLIKKYLKKKNIIFIEDAAHALGSKLFNTKAGNLADISAFSFYSTKIITTGEGGMITTNNKKLAKKCEQFRSRGIKLSSDYEIYDSLGTNHRITEFQGLLGLVQLKSLDKFISHRNSIAKIYNNLLSRFNDQGILILPKIESANINSFWRYIIILRKGINRKKILFKLRNLSIDAISSYDPLIHKQSIINKYKKLKKQKLIFSEEYSRRHVMLPIHYKIKKNDAKFIANSLIKILSNEIK